MKIYIELLLVALIAIYIVDISGFTQSWRNLVARKLGVKETDLRDLPPFDCGKCMSWWVCLIYALCVGHFNLYTVAFSAAMSLLSVPIGQGMIFTREWVCWIIRKLMP